MLVVSINVIFYYKIRNFKFIIEGGGGWGLILAQQMFHITNQVVEVGGGEGVVMPKTFIQINVCLLAYLPVNEHNAILNMGNILP